MNLKSFVKNIILYIGFYLIFILIAIISQQILDANFNITEGWNNILYVLGIKKESLFLEGIFCSYNLSELILANAFLFIPLFVIIWAISKIRYIHIYLTKSNISFFAPFLITVVLFEIIINISMGELVLYINPPCF